MFIIPQLDQSYNFFKNNSSKKNFILSILILYSLNLTSFRSKYELRSYIKNFSKENKFLKLYFAIKHFYI